jgi:hypothetical protein
LFSFCFVTKESGEFSSISENLCPTLKEVRSSVERASLEDNEENKQSILRYPNKYLKGQSHEKVCEIMT